MATLSKWKGHPHDLGNATKQEFAAFRVANFPQVAKETKQSEISLPQLQNFNNNFVFIHD